MMPLIPLDENTTNGPSQFVVDYYVVTPRGTRGRFTLRTGLYQILNAQSETAVLAYLRKRHPGTEIQIQTLKFV